MSIVLHLPGGHLAPRDFIYTVKYEQGDLMSSDELNVNSDTPVGKKNIVNSFEFQRHSQAFLCSGMFGFTLDSPSTCDIIAIVAKLNRYFANIVIFFLKKFQYVRETGNMFKSE